MPITSDTALSPALARFRDAITQAASNRTPLTLRGGGTKDFYGRAPAPDGTVLDTREWSGIVDYDCAELVITARSGTPLVEIEAALAEHRQMLAFEPPHFAADGKQATVGGAFSAGLSGPRRQSVGALRDFVLGAVVMDGRGDMLNFGGQVMKNVAGYDVSRLMAGALGTLGLIVQVSLKVLPMPFCDATLRFAMPQAEAIDTLNRWGGQPLPIAASAWIDGALWVRLSGADAAVRAEEQPRLALLPPCAALHPAPGRSRAVAPTCPPSPTAPDSPARANPGSQRCVALRDRSGSGPRRPI